MNKMNRNQLSFMCRQGLLQIYFVIILSLLLIPPQGFCEANETTSSPAGVLASSSSFLWTPPEPNTMEWETYWQTLRDKLVAKEVSLDTWKKQWTIYFKDNSFTVFHLQAWDSLLQRTPEFESDLLVYASVFILQSLLQEVQKQIPSFTSISLSSQFLLKTIDNLKESQMIQLTEMTDSELKKNPIQLERMWNILLQQFLSSGGIPNPNVLAPMYESVIYLCMLLSAYLSPNKFLTNVQLPEPMKSFFNDFNILIFDGGILTEPHYHSLRSIFSCFPPKLHNIKIIIIPERVGVSATQLFIPLQYGIVTDLPFIPMEIMSNPMEFPMRYGTQIAPEFSMQAVVQVIRAIQYVQFRIRPELPFRRNALLMNARIRNYNYIRPTIRPEVYFSNPDELIPLSSYLWILNSEKALQMANDLLKIRQYFTTDVFLLLADMLSEGKNATLTYYMDESGYLTVREAPVIRAPIDEGYPSVITILPERAVPSFSVKEGRDSYVLDLTEKLNPSIQQGERFSSGFNSPSPGNTNNPTDGQISIETKEN